MSTAEERREATEQLALVLSEHGMQRMTARVMAAVIFAEQPALTQGDLAAELSVSTGSVSGAVTMLTSVGLVERVPAAGSRRDHYRLRDDAWARLFSKQNEVVAALLRMAEHGVEVTAEDGFAQPRLEEMRDFYAFMLGEFPALIERWREQRAARSR
ncbi:GbsR/MarR family transcriptional regulator [Streptomonospora salina]|uniref:DNA-binding transcriptional regulator GbsR (MarR family) n=1 Tax=Streptomonospora salina TaxID=104205 RepID=A0A841EBV7_9ACTN|nr:MarR family transcriptional regulator [Streptomonospora salina]MBB5996931.1 DNA-binding transcriptional regulator GbsR (MarR family) [Streptomonospora salina]